MHAIFESPSDCLVCVPFRYIMFHWIDSHSNFNCQLHGNIFQELNMRGLFSLLFFGIYDLVDIKVILGLSINSRQEKYGAIN